LQSEEPSSTTLRLPGNLKAARQEKQYAPQGLKTLITAEQGFRPHLAFPNLSSASTSKRADGREEEDASSRPAATTCTEALLMVRARGE